MIGKGKSISHTGKALGYAENKLDAREIDRKYVVGENFKEIRQEFKVLQSVNHHCEKNTLAFVVSPTIADGNKLTDQDWREISQGFLKKMGLQEHQSVSYLHTDTEHKHLHIYVNRIDFAGKAYQDNFLSNRSAQIAKEIAHARGLTLAQQVKTEQQRALIPKSEIILEAHRSVLSHAPRQVAEYTRLMKERGVESHLKHDSKGLLVGVTFELAGERIKASDIDRNLTGKKLELTLIRNANKLEQERKEQQKLALQRAEEQRKEKEKQEYIEKFNIKLPKGPDHSRGRGIGR